MPTYTNRNDTSKQREVKIKEIIAKGTMREPFDITEEMTEKAMQRYLPENFNRGFRKIEVFDKTSQEEIDKDFCKKLGIEGINNVVAQVIIENEVQESKDWMNLRETAREWSAGAVLLTNHEQDLLKEMREKDSLRVPEKAEDKTKKSQNWLGKAMKSILGKNEEKNEEQPIDAERLRGMREKEKRVADLVKRISEKDIKKLSNSEISRMMISIGDMTIINGNLDKIWTMANYLASSRLNNEQAGAAAQEQGLQKVREKLLKNAKENMPQNRDRDGNLVTIGSVKEDIMPVTRISKANIFGEGYDEDNHETMREVDRRLEDRIELVKKQKKHEEEQRKLDLEKRDADYKRRGLEEISFNMDILGLREDNPDFEKIMAEAQHLDAGTSQAICNDQRSFESFFVKAIGDENNKFFGNLIKTGENMSGFETFVGLGNACLKNFVQKARDCGFRKSFAEKVCSTFCKQDIAAEFYNNCGEKPLQRYEELVKNDKDLADRAELIYDDSNPSFVEIKGKQVDVNKMIHACKYDKLVKRYLKSHVTANCPNAAKVLAERKQAKR